MKTHKKFLFPLLIIFSLMTFTTAFAQSEEASPCEGESVAGTVVDVDEETDTATIDTGDGLCTVTLDGEYDHPIVSILGAYFNDASVESLNAALDATEGCALLDEETGEYTWVDCETEGAVEVTVTGENEDGSFNAENAEGEDISVTVEDEEAAGELSSALETLNVEWEIDENGSVSDAGDDIAAYHDSGIGFGVLVKIYAIAEESQEACAAEAEAAAAEGETTDGGTTEGETPTEEPPVEEEPCGVTVEELMALYEGGMSMGEMFKEYGKPSMLGVGHVMQALGETPGSGGDGDGDGSDSGVCNARDHGGAALANGKDVNCD
ncbi:MAG: hypothetical protein OEZ02_10850 [Anaerolineae bacterium]|nr:hypothetical protein [Anaerolineae bacterium]